MRTGSLAAALFLLPLTAACSAESRLWRLSPMHRDDAPRDEKTDRAERLNLWPLAYAEPTGGSVLWPLIDFDGHGFAVRPLVSRDDEDLDVLFPLSHFDLGTGDGWALNWYSLGDNVGLFPLFHAGPEFGYVLPAWWTKEDGKLQGGGLFPIAAFGEFNYVGLAWWTDPPEGERSLGLFPLVTWSSLRQFGPAWWWEDGDAWGVFPLVWSDRGGDDLVAFPLYFQRVRPEHADRLLFPLWYWRERGDERLFVTPLGGRGWSSDGDTRFVNVLGPVFHRSVQRDAATDRVERATTSFLWPIVQHERAGDESSFRVWPLWGQSNAVDPPDPLYEWTLAGRHANGKRWSNHLFPLYSARGDEFSGEQSALLSLLHHERTPTGDRWRAWPLVSTDSTAGGKSFGDTVADAFTLVGVDRKPERSHLHVGTRLLFDLDRYGEEKRSWKAGFLLNSFLVESRVDRTKEGGSREETHCRLPLLHEYRKTRDATGERKEWDLLCWTVHSVEDANEDSVNVLGGYAYRWERKGDRTERDIFPFVTYDTAPDSSRFSFLWRFFEYRREGERRGGHVLFVPWGEHS
jgi:hypothetical protein